MAKTNFESVDDYLAAQPEGARQVLLQVRNAIRKAVPNAAEGISYQMPVYKAPSGPVLYFAGWKKHYSLYPASTRMLEALPELAKYEISKGTIRLPYDEPVPLRLIGRIAKLRANGLA